MQMTKPQTPELIQLFTNLLWANTPKNWIFKSVYYNNTLFVSVSIKTIKIRRSFNSNIINDRVNDLWGMCRDCIDEMQSEFNK